ncbi:hypothetical protein NUW54_g11047 [Trametes sanguinea]|uniref:Uncharacterized protein n=1 Tax=Trametes sanguinea TaxID=158606 RepID=A0ACC1NMJ6_9APHY|nr:hypothetical protein NUW54_g11047 [Trametes sanguinea]
MDSVDSFTELDDDVLERIDDLEAGDAGLGLVDTGVSVPFGDARFCVSTDTVTLAPSLVIENQSIGVASTAQGFQGVDGILGIGPVDLTEGTVGGNQAVPTVTDNLFAQGTIENDLIGIFYQPTTSEGALNGELDFGSVDTGKYVVLEARENN